VSDIPGWALLVAVFREPLPLASPAVGVGHIRTHLSSDTDLFVSKLSFSADVDSRSM
jgi:hypothetical protein